METPVQTSVAKIARKLAMAVLIAIMTLFAYSLWLFVGENGDYHEHRATRSSRMEAQRAEVSAQLADVSVKTDVAIATLASQQQRALQAEKLLKSLHELDPGTLDRLVGDGEQHAQHEARIASTAKIKTEAQTRVVELQREVVLGEQKRTDLKLRLSAVEAEQAALRAETNAAGHYLRVAWQEGAWLVYTLFFVYLFGGLAVAALLYFGWARLAAKGKPVQLRTLEVAQPSISESAIGVEHSLWPGERLWVKKRFLQSADSALTRRTRLLPDWKRPLSWVLCGSQRLVELRNERSDGERQVVFTSMSDPFAELAVVSVPEGGSFVMRAGFVMGMIADISRRPVIRRHWYFRSWQSWVAGQFGYWEFCGPCRLVVSCVSTLNAKTLSSPDEKKPLSSRAMLAAVVGFSPQLMMHPVRTDSFWDYCRRRAPLFDQSLAGTGTYLTRELAGRARDGVKARILKRFGL